MIAFRPATVLFVCFLFATCSPVEPGEECACPPTHECVAGVCVCPTPDRPCRLDCDPADDSCDRGFIDPVDCVCRSSVTNRIESIDVDPTSFSLEIGETRQLLASGSFESGDVLDVTRSVTWGSDDPSVARVEELSGLVTAVAAGSATITAVSGSILGLSQATVFSDNGGNGGNGGNGEPELVYVSHDREFRGAWVATAWGINFPSSTSSASAQQTQLQSILDALVDNGLNVIVFQVRPESDAFYASDLEPWSRFLTGTQGQSPGYDPLAYLIEQAHARGIEVHAWLNPYRGLVNRSVSTAANHVSRRFSDYSYDWGDNLLWLDPGATVVRDHIVDVVVDIVDRYEVDGIHFDDYFYPWPISGWTFPDSGLYQAYTSAGGTMSLADWRRDNVDEMVRLVGEAIIEVKPHVRFGISPFGIYRTGEPPNISGTSQYDVLYSDPKKWIQERWVDYLAPQLYWPTSSTGQPYGVLLPWWTGLSAHGHYIFAGNALWRLGDGPEWTVDEFRQQVQISRDYRHQHSMGNIYYHVANILSDRSGVASMLRDEFYSAPALTPPVVAVRDNAVASPGVEVNGSLLTMEHDDLASIRAWVVYASVGQEWVVDRIVPSAETSFVLPDGVWAISAACRGNVESKGVVVEIGF